MVAKKTPAKRNTAVKPGAFAKKGSKSSAPAQVPDCTASTVTEPGGMDARFPIVGIGASAGGLEAYEQLLKHMPVDCDMAFVLVQHLDPTHKSLLTDLVKRITPIRVFEVIDGVKVEPNCAYIIPPNRDMAILHGRLQLIEPSAPRGARLPIDLFFRSLAQDLGERAIGIVLSGTGTDGTLGLQAIKEAGGMVMVQEPNTAKYDGMPRSAMATGLADFVLAPDQMAKQLLAFRQHAFAPGSKQIPAPVPQGTENLEKIYVLLRDQTGHDFSYYKPNTILRRIERRMTVNQINGLPDYVHYLQSAPFEVETLFKELLIGVSGFFRDPEAFQALEDKVIPALFKDRPSDDAVRVWVPGCSTGEEAYSIAILLREQMERLKQEYKLNVFATDIDSTAIDKARAGVYPDSIAADVSPERLSRFFTKQDNTYQISKSVRDILVFAEQNVIKDPPFSRLDLISCRNLLIYLEGELQKRLLPLFHYALRKDGYLFLGNSETVGDANGLFATLERKWKIFQREGSVLPHSAGIEMHAPPFPLDLGRGKGMEVKPMPALSYRELTEQLLLEDYAPASVLVSQKGEGLYFYGDTSRYLQTPVGEASWNILGLARDGLRLDLTTALRKVPAQKKPIRFEKVKVRSNGGNRYINLTVKPVPNQPGQGETMMVVFEEIPAPDTVVSAESSGSSAATDLRVVEMERELRSTREYLQATIEELETANEELKSTNEELQSSNEELQSTNEELETSKEELQSVNEELVTVNAEHEVKLDELSKTSNDMANLLASTEIGTIFLDEKFCIQRFTPAATQIIKLIRTDVGRPLSDIATKLQDDGLLKEVTEILDTLAPREREVQTTDGRWYLARIRPYRTTTNVIEGVVITFIDIDEQKQVQERLLSLSQAVERSPNAVIISDADGKIEYVNPYFTRQSGLTVEEVIGKGVSLIWSEATPKAVLQEMWRTVNAGDVWQGELQSQRKGGGQWSKVSIYPVKNKSGNISHVVGIQMAISEPTPTSHERH